MEKIVKKIKMLMNFCILNIIVGVAFTQVSLEIKNVDRSAGTLDIYMTNEAGCSYCSDPSNNTPESCNLTGNNWLFTAGMTDAECQAQTGQYFNGLVSGFQFFLTGLMEGTVSGAGGSAADAGLFIDGNINSAGYATLIGFSMTGGSVPAGNDLLLTTLTFTGASGDICIPVQDCSNGQDDQICSLNLNNDTSYTNSDNNPVMSDTSGSSIITSVGPCNCSDASQTDLGCGCGETAVPDCAGVCGGTAVNDCAGVCGGTAVVGGCDNACGSTAVNDCAGVCGGTAVNDCAGVCGGTCTACDGDGVCSDALSVDTSLPNDFRVAQNYPNPFNPTTRINFYVEKIEETSLIVYDLAGNEIKILTSGVYQPGEHSVVWDATNYKGEPVSSGMYIYKYVSGINTMSKKMLYMK